MRIFPYGRHKTVVECIPADEQLSIFLFFHRWIRNKIANQPIKAGRSGKEWIEIIPLKRLRIKMYGKMLHSLECVASRKTIRNYFNKTTKGQNRFSIRMEFTRFISGSLNGNASRMFYCSEFASHCEPRNIQYPAIVRSEWSKKE